MRSHFLLALASLTWAAGVSSASADEWLLFPVVGEVPDTAQRSAISGVAGVALGPQRTAQVRPSPGGCDTPECVRETVRSVGASGGLLVRAFAQDGALQSFTAVVVQGQSVREGSATVESSDWRSAVRAAVVAALAERVIQTVTLRVVGTPEDAAVTLDGAPLGTLPAHAQVTVGEHRLAVGRIGHRDYTERLTIEGDRVVRVDLEREESDPVIVPDPHPAPRSSAGNGRLIAGISLLSAGVIGGVVNTAWSLARTGCQAERPEGCYDHRSLAVGPFLGWTALALASAATGLVLIISRPAPNTSAGATLHVGVGHLDLHLRF